jgi:Bromodomain
MKIKLPDASSEGAGGALLTKEGLSPSHPVSTPGSPTSVTGKVLNGASDSDTSVGKTRTSRKRPRPVSARKPRAISRLVSQEFSCHEVQDTPCVSSAGEEDDMSCGDLSADDFGTAVSYENSFVRSSPRSYSRRVSDFGVTESCQIYAIPPLPNPLHHRPLHDAHVLSLRLERELAPMRQILFKLMSNPTYNRRGLFNVPVDHVALDLVDYTRIVTKPMDLGTVKAKLQALAYTCRVEVAEDIRLVFHNAIMYNPQEQFVHIAARNLQGIFEAAYLEICNGLNGVDDSEVCASSVELTCS